MRLISAAVALCCTLLLAACFPPITKNSIGGTAATGDPALMGLWSGQMENSDKDDDKVYFHFVPLKDGGMTILLVSAKKTGDGDIMAATANATKAGSNRFLNAKLIPVGNAMDGDQQPDGTVPVLYRWEGKHLVLYLMDEKATKAAINAKRIAGAVESGEFGDATITADQAALDAFMAGREGTALFSSKFAVLTRMD